MKKINRTKRQVQRRGVAAKRLSLYLADVACDLQFDAFLLSRYLDGNQHAQDLTRHLHEMSDSLSDVATRMMRDGVWP